MTKGAIFLFTTEPNLASFLNEPDLDKSTLVQIIIILLLIILVLLTIEIRRAVLLRQSKPLNLFRFFKKVKLEVNLEKDRSFKPRILILTIRNTGTRETNIEAPVLEYRKIWTKRKFRLNGMNGNPIYPMFIDPGKVHQLRIDTTAFHEYDRSIKSFYRAKVRVRDVNGRQWKSNTVILRKSLVT